VQTQREATGWVGWIYFAGFMMIIIGSLNAIYGLVALFNDDWVVWGNQQAVFLDISAWGWVHLVAGVIVLLTGIGVMTGNIVARTVGVIIVGISLIANFLAIPVYPVWSLVMIAIEVFVIYALTAHGREVKT
jgi:hypothetical protein